MKRLPKFILLIVSIAFLTTTSCKKQSDCYDRKLYEQHRNDICTMDCPSVIGCDGKTYCNECEANKKGIRVKK
jgi:hypothetical protein